MVYAKFKMEKQEEKVIFFFVCIDEIIKCDIHLIEAV